jgi:single-strand DNA-binding protein
MATSRAWTKDGEKHEETEWHNIVVFGKQGENCGKFLTKGRAALVDGEIRTRSYDDKDGNKRYITEIVANNVKFLGGPSGNGTGTSDGEGDAQIPF